MNVVVVIEGREAIPVRAIPLLTNWNSMTPDYLAGVLAEDDGYFDFEGLKAYYVEAGLVHRLEAAWWESYCCRALKECSDNIKITHPELKTHSQWKRESLPLLPAGVFVWKDEYEALHEKSWRLRDYWRTRISPGESEDDQKPLLDRLSLADDRYVREKLNKWRKLNFSPRAQDSGIEHLVMDGFEPEQATEPQTAIPSPTPEPQAALVVEAPASEPKAKRTTAFNGVLPYLQTVHRNGKFKTTDEFIRELGRQSGEVDSPFKKAARTDMAFYLKSGGQSVSHSLIADRMKFIR